MNGDHTLMIAEGQSRANPAAGSADSAQDDREPLASTAFMYIRMSTSGSLFFLNREPISIGAKRQIMTAQSTGEAELMMAISFGGKTVTYLSKLWS